MSSRDQYGWMYGSRPPVMHVKPLDVGTDCLFGTGWVLNPVVRDLFRPGSKS
jgi:hypothetical protein